ncbi:Histidine kinase-like ATPase domain-containing protein [Parafrankia irregularis]|uniref:Histidine kinase-like ATPase domain-containing protein n=1 Tax=Parafrankia irregularis TaxID=795642 RepID=A0A0S4QU97_9ACTN|nr:MULTISPECIES: ATP-binding protein [Frankiaceae]MBE3204844.1 ATP-binding protein [Parafrankia sp. CH37]CUU59189.1 Histidine kinase-like ATPase domain-containing protein [Parafrankia irregularis]
MTAADRSPMIRVAVAHFPPTVAAVPEVRARTAGTLIGWSVDTDAVSTVELVVGELASNAVKVSRPQDVVAVRLTATSGQVVVEVWDSSDVGPRIGSPEAFSEDGRGLVLVDALCSTWSWYRVKSGGKVVWGEIRAELQPMQPGTEAGRLEQRTAQPTPDPIRPVTFEENPALLRRVVDGLRALDDWHLPGARAAPPRTPPPATAVGQPTRTAARRA